MKKVFISTSDDLFRSELAQALPEGYKIYNIRHGIKDEIIFVDIDTVKKGYVRELSVQNFVIAVTSHKKTDPVMQVTAAGAYETICRPLDRINVSSLLNELVSLKKETEDIVTYSAQLPVPTCVIVGSTPVIMDVCKKLARLSQVDAPVLITGETGTGKELIAESIAQLSSRFGRPFVVVNCAAVPETLLESELFGFEKGSFTGALAAKEGMLKVADGGCVFFDEIGELPLPLQGKLLRFLQTQSFYPIGSTKEVHVDVRVISATNRDVKAMIREGKFREDLYHRLSVTSIHIPPLRERKNDIPALVHFFIGRYQHTAPRPIKGVTVNFLKKLTSYNWPGNIRELENVIRSAIAMSKTHYLTTYELRDLLLSPSYNEKDRFPDNLSSVLLPYVKQAVEKKEKNIYEKIQSQVDRIMIDFVLSLTKENQSEAARILGINRLTLRKKMKL